MSRDINVSLETEGEELILRFDSSFRRALVELIRPILAAEASLPSSVTRSSGERPAGEREFINAKEPRGHHQVVAVLAYWLRESGVPEFNADDMRRAYIRANQRQPKVMAQALRDAKNKYELLESGSKPNYFRLSTHGERTVLFDLPAASTN